MYIYMCVYIYTYIYVYLYVYIYIYTHTFNTDCSQRRPSVLRDETNETTNHNNRNQ